MAKFHCLLECRVLNHNASKKLQKCQMNNLQNGYLKFSKTNVFRPPPIKIRFFKHKYLQNQNFDYSLKIVLHIIELYSNNQCTKFQANIFIFGCAMAQKPCKGDDTTFLKRNFWHVLLWYVKTNDIFGMLRQS